MLLFHRIPTMVGLALLLGLSACATPQQRCIAGATADYRTLQTQIKTAESNIARGYALHRQSIPITNTRVCYDGNKNPYTCQRTAFRQIETPVSIDIDNEKAKLAGLKAKLATAQRKAVAGTKVCRQTYPE
ncbi:hypothetical protein SAMN05444851_1030 [Aliiroseovarius sediminilitoris]|uniref:Uncharacterized protein n=1 Tax=Aliiroseovarius sediminilitoris TaxID=1173584 RepID=A0A1I0NRG1_9RHOB|nr:hypothetical protein [Aliiroseovarius sediminilitoris]SEW04019.1 hypothetical protein SAMN05444851_1030 [Aliiroseovarius sediminilitoris]